tara:strand:- start:33 stop:452 length:420 start_codon:yes stop_codon:yes gene_type:complete
MLMVRRSRHTSISKRPNSFCKTSIVRAGGSTITQGAQIFGWIKAKGAPMPKRTNGTALIGGEVCLTTVFNQCQIMTSSQLRQCREVRRLTIEVDRNDRGSSWGYGRPNGGRVKRETVFVNIDKDRCGTASYDGDGCKPC